MAAIYFKGASSLFVLMASIFIELILLFIGAFMLRNKTAAKEDDIGLSGAFYALLACTFFIYPMTYILANSYNEFSKPEVYGYLQPFVDYKWELIVMTISLGIGYLVDFKTLRANSIGQFISSEVIRVSFLLFGVGILGMMWLEWLDDMSIISSPNNPFTHENKMIPILTIISARMLFEIWYLKRVKIYTL